MAKIGVHFGPHIPVNDLGILNIINRVYQGKPGIALVMEGSDWIANAMPLGSITIQRINHLFEHISLTYTAEGDEMTEQDCYDFGYYMAGVIMAVYPNCQATHFMGICEPQFDSIMDGRRLGAFDAGLADGFIALGYGYCALNVSMGKGESRSTPSSRPVIEAYAQSLNQWSSKLNLHDNIPTQKLIWGYHMYDDGVEGLDYLEHRPWAFWQQDLESIGIVMPKIVGTEAGMDPPDMDKLLSYIRRFGSFNPDALGCCIYGIRMGEKWTRFDYEGNEQVIQAMENANKEGGEMLDSTMDFKTKMDSLWQRAQQRIWTAPMFYKMWVRHRDVLGEKIGGEFDAHGYRFQECEFGYIYALIDDWANTYVALYRESMPGPLV